MEQKLITDVTKAQAAIAFLISEGWQIDLHKVNKEIPNGLGSADWLRIANVCLNVVADKLAEDKVIPIALFRH